MLEGQAILEVQARLGAALAAAAPWWRPRPWDGEPGWVEGSPALVDTLLALDDAELERAARAPWQELAGAPWPDPLRRLQAEVEGAWPDRIGTAVDAVPTERVKSRKRAQLAGFVGALEALSLAGAPVVEGGSGYGHLGRALADRRRVPALLLEKDPALCVAVGPDIRHVEVDLLDPQAGALVPEGALLVGLHACGALTDRLAAIGVSRGVASLALAPCCPHRREDPVWNGLAAVSRAAGLDLSPDELRLAVRDDGVASARRHAIRRHRQQVNRAWAALARAQGRTVVRPPWGRAAWDAPWEELVARLIAEGRLAPVSASAVDEAWDASARELARIRRLEVVRFAVRRSLELWTVLDRAAWLVEQGWATTVGTFCDPADSPRRILIASARP